MQAQMIANRVARAVQYLDWAIKGAVALSIFLIMAIICIQVFYRFVLNDARPWPEEATRFLMIWSLFVAGAYVFYDQEHARITYVSERLPRMAKVVVDGLINVLIIILFAVVIYAGVQQMDRLHALTTGGLGVSRAIPIAALPVSAILYIAVAAYLILRPFARGRS